MTSLKDELAKEKENEIESELADELTDLFSDVNEPEVESFAEDVVDASVKVNGPETSDYIYQITADHISGKSTKPGNIWFRPTKVLELTASGALTIGTTVQLPVLAPAAALILWKNIWRTFSIDVSTEEAFIYWSIWKNRSEEGLTRKTELPELVHEELDESDLELNISNEKVESSILRLKDINAIQEVDRGSVEYYRCREYCKVSWN